MKSDFCTEVVLLSVPNCKVYYYDGGDLYDKNYEGKWKENLRDGKVI